VTNTTEKKHYLSSFKIKAIASVVLLIAVFYILCYNFTTTKELALKTQTELLKNTDKTEESISQDQNHLDPRFLKDLDIRWAEFSTKLEKERSAMFFISKTELTNFLNLNSNLKDWQKNKIFKVENQTLFSHVFIPVVDIPFLKYFPGINNRIVHLKMGIIPISHRNTAHIAITSLALPNWDTPLKAINIKWPINIPNQTWKHFNAMIITEFGVFLKFEISS